MIRRIIGIAALAATVALPVLAQAQGVPGGIERGSREGERAAGPVGSRDRRRHWRRGRWRGRRSGHRRAPRFRSYVIEHHHPSYQYDQDVRVGVVLPEDGVGYYEVPREYGARDYRYAVVNGRTVLVEPRTHRIVQIIE